MADLTEDGRLPSAPGHSGFAPSPDGLGHAESVPDAAALAANLSVLAERCEAAEGPDRALDEAIADLLLSDKQLHHIKGLSDAEGGMWMWRNPDGSVGTALRFTGSLDAAMKLVPEGWDLDLQFYHTPTAWLGKYGAPIGVVGTGETLILALCAAALKARAHAGGAHG